MLQSQSLVADLHSSATIIGGGHDAAAQVAVVSQWDIDQINRCHDELKAAADTVVEKAFEIGAYLIAIKNQMKHGDFREWVDEHLAFGRRSAQNYMLLAERRERIKEKRSALRICPCARR